MTNRITLAQGQVLFAGETKAQVTLAQVQVLMSIAERVIPVADPNAKPQACFVVTTSAS